MGQPQDSKYVVIKKSDITQKMNYYSGNPNLRDGIRVVMDMALSDAVVIRRQDVFAPPALDAYASGIAVALEVLTAAGHGESEGAKHLRSVADYFHEQAQASWDTHRKLPD
jgi:hypothetical protein